MSDRNHKPASFGFKAKNPIERNGGIKSQPELLPSAFQTRRIVAPLFWNEME